MIPGNQREKERQGGKEPNKACLIGLVPAVHSEAQACQGSHAEIKVKSCSPRTRVEAFVLPAVMLITAYTPTPSHFQSWAYGLSKLLHFGEIPKAKS